MKSSHVQIENNYFVNVYVYVFMNGRQRAKSSANSKERLDSLSSVSCVGEEGKLLVKGELSNSCQLGLCVVDLWAAGALLSLFPSQVLLLLETQRWLWASQVLTHHNVGTIFDILAALSGWAVLPKPWLLIESNHKVTLRYKC
ncbi:uncharacterized protein LOC110041511 [Orbicella faveolata]|uniref:uncharacterized protein LOC110041511 n=1 Tax=Orbicella faveolata TaxID=48498 RepID=UPI0009E3E7AE|nr:uncharacterized protein LOC110041511 [Orbicella faveolata]